MASLCGLALIAILAASSRQEPVVEGVTFDSDPRTVYVPVRDAARFLDWKSAFDPVVGLAQLNGKTLDPRAPQLSDGSFLISTKTLHDIGAAVKGNEIADKGRNFRVSIGPKRVYVDLTNQVLRAWQGQRLVYQWQVSSGREGKATPTGDYYALDKEKLHISKLYGSPMPFSVHVTGNIYIHGSDRFTKEPGSHGCIRLPVMETRNIAEEFYDWIGVGTPIKLRGFYNFTKARAKTSHIPYNELKARH